MHINLKTVNPRSYLLERLHSENEDSKARVLDYASPDLIEKNLLFRLCGGSLGSKRAGSRSMLKSSESRKI